jgi:hypothetical protein
MNLCDRAVSVPLRGARIPDELDSARRQGRAPRLEANRNLDCDR